MKKPADHYTGIILSGGKGTRVGRDKGLIELNGRKMVEYAIDILSPFCTEIIISSNNPDYHSVASRIVPDISAGYGPMMGVYSALKSSSTTLNLILAVDNIFVTGAFYRYLLSKNLPECMIAVPYVNDKYFEPLVGYYSKGCIPAMEQMMEEDNYKLPDLFTKVPVLKLMVEKELNDFHAGYFQSLNNPEDLLSFSASHRGLL
ncbi:MAG: molybdenum cofactor guanylyltransferase [bacterium]